ncbi:MAG: hypothetical protein K0R29_735 [Pseudobdellovibrio sp.]|nr:hypothetical protein [Pseudobdellovibrio sp.]
MRPSVTEICPVVNEAFEQFVETLYECVTYCASGFTEVAMVTAPYKHKRRPDENLFFILLFPFPESKAC